MTVLQLVARERTRLRLALAARGAALAITAAAILMAAATIALSGARWITRPSAPIGAWMVVVLGAAAFAWWTWRAARRAASSARVAAAIEEERELRPGALRGALEVAHSGPLGRRAAERLAAQLGQRRAVLAPSLQWRAWRLGLLAAGGAVLALASLALAREAGPDGWRALRHPVSAWTGELLPALVILDPPSYVMRGEQVRLRIAAPERRVISLHVRSTGAAWREDIVPVDGGTAVAELGPVDADLTLVATDGRARSDTVVVRVTDRPFIGDVSVRATYPAYLERPSEALALGEPLRLPRGTVLTLGGRASTALRAVALVRGTDTLLLAPDGHRFTGRVVAIESGRWDWRASGVAGDIAELPQPLELVVVPDSAPAIEILSPMADTLIAATDRVDLRAEATDDHGVSVVLMRSWRQPAGANALPDVTQPLAAPGAPRWAGTTIIPLAERGLEPGDELHVVLLATDNSPWRQTAASRELVLRVPTLNERRELARAMADSTVSRAEAAAKEQRQLERRTGDAARSRARRGERPTGPRQRDGRQPQQAMDYQSAEQAEALAKQQQELAEKVDQLRRDARALEEQLRAAGALDSALAERLRETQRMLQDAVTPELQRQLEELSKATRQLDAQQTREALENLERQQRRLREQLERSAEMLKRAALEGAMQTLRDEAREIAQKERETADALERGDSAAVPRGRKLADRASNLSEGAQRLSKRLEDAKGQTGPPKLRDAAERARESAEAMRRATPQGQQSQEQSAREQRGEAARDAARRMEDAAQQLSDAREGQIQEWKQELTGELDRAIQEMLQMAREQESLAQRARQGDQQNSLQADQSALQQGVNKVGERLEQEARKSTHVSPQAQGAVGDAQKKVEEATQRTAESQRGGTDAAQAMEQAAQALNRAAAALVRDREQVNRSGSASGFAEMVQRMREMAKEQGGLNAQAAGLLPIPGGKPSQQMAAQARTLAGQQRGLANKLDEAGRDAGSGRATELAKEMRQIADALESGQVDQAVLERQQRLFRRLLDAGLSLEKDERDDRGERESRSATGNEGVFTPAGEARGRPLVRYREPTWSELRGLTPDERRAVLEYFKRINADQRP